MNQIEFQSVDFFYSSLKHKKENPIVLEDITLRIAKGEFVALLGVSGSGKSTFLKLCNALLLPAKGTIHLGGFNTRDEEHVWEIRKTAGMIFQEPDCQIIGATVAEDIAFGPENLGLPSLVIQRLVREALNKVVMEAHADRATNLLSIAQKLRIALAGLLAMQPECLLIDEAATLLNPAERREFMSLLHRLNREEKLTVILGTRNIEEIAGADRIIILDNRKIALDVTTERLLTSISNGAGIHLPQVTRLSHLMRTKGCCISVDNSDSDQAVEELLHTLNGIEKNRGAH